MKRSHDADTSAMAPPRAMPGGSGSGSSAAPFSEEELLKSKVAAPKPAPREGAREMQGEGKTSNGT